MGFWSGLGKVLGGIGAGIAAPLTGGASLMALPTLIGGAVGGLGSVASSAAKGSADGRLLESRDEMVRNQLAQDAAKGNIAADSARMRQAILAKLLGGGLQDASIAAPASMAGRIGKVSGGLRPSALAGAGGGADIAAAIRPRLMRALMEGGEIPMPGAAPGPSKLDKGLEWTGLASSLLGAASPLFRKPQPTTPPYLPGRITGTMPPGVTMYGGR